MMLRRIASLALGALLLAGTALATSPSHMRLTLDGSLYRIERAEVGLVVNIAGPTGTSVVVVPQTGGIDTADLSMGYDERTGTAVVLWTETLGYAGTRLQLATYREGTWFGPIEIASSETALETPALMVQAVSQRGEAKTLDDSSEEILDEDLSSSFIHVAWWQQNEDGGHAVYLPIELLDDGSALIDEASATPLRDFLPYGVQCDLPEDTSSLTPPQFFIDPETGDPHLFFTNLGDCLFQIIQLRADEEIEEGTDETVDDGTTADDDPATSKRRRHVIVFGNRFDITMSPDLPVDDASLEVGHGMSVVAWWESDQTTDPEAETEPLAPALEYLVMDGDGWSAVRSLPVSDEISRDHAIDMIRSLALR